MVRGIASWFLLLASLALPPTVGCETVALPLERKGVKKPEQMVYGLDLAKGRVVWEHRFGEEVNFVEKVNAGLLVGCDDGTLSLLHPATGELKWSTKLGQGREKVNTFRGEFPAGYLVSFDNEVVWVVSSKGQLLWTMRWFGEDINFVERVNAGLLLGRDNGTLTLLDPATGEVRWNVQLGEKGEQVNTFRGEFASGYLVSFHNEVVWLVSPKGQLLWTLR